MSEQKPNDAPQPVETPETAEAAGAVAAPSKEAPRQAVAVAKAPSPPEGRHYFWGTGRRKKSIARVRIKPGEGKIVINNREMDQYFVHEQDRNAVLSPLTTAQMRSAWDVFVNVSGGGATGQAGAVCLGLARALARAVPEVEHDLRDKNLLTRDARMKERKKYGQKGARKGFQFSKR